MAKKKSTKPPADDGVDAVMVKVRQKWEDRKAKGLTMHELGVQMGYHKDHARKSVSQFLKSNDPRISMLRKFAKAMKLSLSELVK